MQKYFAAHTLYPLPSDTSVHPSRLIIRDGTLTWRDALHCKLTDVQYLPTELAHEQHIIKTAQRLEELNTWASQGLELWECIKPRSWYNPMEDELCEGISLYFLHTVLSPKLTMSRLKPHIKAHEELEMRGKYLFFKRC